MHPLDALRALCLAGLGAAFAGLGCVLHRGALGSFAQASASVDGESYLLCVSTVRETTDAKGERSDVCDVVVIVC